MMPLYKQLDKLFAEHASRLMASVQQALSGPYIDQVVKAEWPKESGYNIFIGACAPASAVRTVSLKHSAIESPRICLDDLRLAEDVNKTIKDVERCFVANLKYLWKITFRRDIINTIQKHSIARYADGPALFDLEPRKVNFFGKEVRPYLAERQSQRQLINPKYKRAATQYVEFNPDIVHFLFPDLNQWAGNLTWRNVLDSEHNIEGGIGFFRVLLSYAAKPMRPDLGSVTTVPPPGFIGTLWYWAWKLVSFVP